MSDSETAPARRRPPRLVLVLDANDADRLADFWSAALGYDRQEALEPFEILTPPAVSDAPARLIQRVNDPKLGKNRMHLDLHVADAEAEAERLVMLGARRLGDDQLGEIRWILITDPEGNEFDIGWD